MARKRMIKSAVPWIFVLPGVVFTIWLRYYPILKSFYISLFQYDAIHPPGSFVGLKNYANILTESKFWEGWRNTGIFMILLLAITFIPPLLQALFLSVIRIGRNWFSTIYLLTALIPVSINVIVWKWIWNPDAGAANTLLKLFGADAHLWLNDPRWVKFCIVFPGFIGGGVIVLIYLAAILGIPGELNEAAQMDGCSGWSRLWHIVIPNIKFVIVIQLMMAVIGGLQLLDAPFQFTGGGPAGTSTTIGIYIYDTFHRDMAYGKSSAASVLLFGVIALVTFIQMQTSKSKEG